MLIGAGEIISRSFKLYRENFSLFAKYASLIFVPFLVLFVGLAAGGLGGLLTGNLSDSSEAGVGVGITIAILAGLVFFYLSLWFTFALIRVIAARYNGIMPDTVGQELSKTRAVVLSGLLTSILTGLIILGGIILFIIPGIIFSIWFYFSVYNVIMDGQKPVDALRESKKMVLGRWWSVLWRLLAPGFVFGVLAIVLELVLSAPFALAGSESILFIGMNTLVSVLVNILIVPLSSAALVILFLELKKVPAGAQTPPPIPQQPMA